MASVALMEYFKKTRRKQTESSELLESWDVMYDSLVSSDKKIEILVAENEKMVGKLRGSQEAYDWCFESYVLVDKERSELCSKGLKTVKLLESIEKFANETQNESLLNLLKNEF